MLKGLITYLTERVIFLMVFYAPLVLSQNQRDQKRIDSCFMVLNKQPDLASSVTCNKAKPFPFYEMDRYQTILLEERVKSGGYCTKYLVSCRLELLKEIHMIFCHDENGFYNLVDSSGNRIFDLVKYNCSGTNGKKAGVIERVNEEKVNDLVTAYNAWYREYKKGNADSLLKKNMYPAAFSKYRWVKEAGYISGIKSNAELLKIFRDIQNDENYGRYFVKHNVQAFLKPGFGQKELLTELTLLALMNNYNTFTHDVLKFEIRHKPSDAIPWVKLREELLNAGKPDETIDIYEMLDKYGLIISLR